MYKVLKNSMRNTFNEMDISLLATTVNTETKYSIIFYLSCLATTALVRCKDIIYVDWQPLIRYNVDWQPPVRYKVFM